MWQRFTERARKVVFYAQEESQARHATNVSTEHLLLGLIRETDSLAGRILDLLGINTNEIRKELNQQLVQGEPHEAHELSLTFRAKRTIDLAYDEARLLKNNYIGTEHLLLGIIREEEGIAAQVLLKLGATLESARNQAHHIQVTEASMSRKLNDILLNNNDPNVKPHTKEFITVLVNTEIYYQHYNCHEIDEILIFFSALSAPESCLYALFTELKVDIDLIVDEILKSHLISKNGSEKIPALSLSARYLLDQAVIQADLMHSPQVNSAHFFLASLYLPSSGIFKVIEQCKITYQFAIPKLFSIQRLFNSSN